MVIRPGLVSVTFRKLSPAEIVDLVARAGLAGIEWGGDIHVPPGQPAVANEVRELTRRAGLAVAAYGSYYRVGEPDAGEFEPVLESAVELGAPMIRVWAGRQGSAKASPQHRQRVSDESRRIADLAAKAGVEIAYEYHGNSLTDTNESARLLLEQADHPNVRTNWQPLFQEDDVCLAGLRGVLGWLANYHVYYWGPGHERKPLADGAERWGKFFAVAPPAERYALLEFVRDDSPEAFLEDAAALKRILAGIPQ